MSVLRSGTHSPEVVATHTLELLARWMRLILPTFLDEAPDTLTTPWTPINGRLTDTGSIGYVGQAIRLLRGRIAEPWTVGALSRELSLSRTHPVSYTHLTLPTTLHECRSRWSPCH